MSSLTTALAGGAGLAHSGMLSEENFGSHSALDLLPTTASHPHSGSVSSRRRAPPGRGQGEFLVYQN